MDDEVTPTTHRLRLLLTGAGIALIFGTMFLETKIAIVVFILGWLGLVSIVVAYRTGKI